MNSTSVAVLSIPSFDEYGDDAVNTTTATVQEFISRTQAAGLQKVVIDLQQNFGGQVILALEAYKLFFPNVDAFAGSRMRATHPIDVMGSTLTHEFSQMDPTDPDYDVFLANEFVATPRINADTNRNFTSWAEFFGPHLYHGDNFTTTQRYDLGDQEFVDDSMDVDANVTDVFATSTGSAAPPFSAQNIVLLTDGICGSACSLFLEAMHHEAGVRVVSVGGRPTLGPMQGASGPRGARFYDTETLDNNIEFVQDVLANNSSPDTYFLPNRTDGPAIFVVDAAINLRDQVRKQDEATPLQFVYDAADCRIFFTPQTIFNYTSLWQYAADAIWTNPKLCVSGSTGYSTTGATNSTASSTNTTKAPPSSTPSSFVLADHLITSNASIPDAASLDGDLTDLSPRTALAVFESCAVAGSTVGCTKGFVCAPVQRCANSPVRSLTCVAQCSYQGQACQGGSCVITGATGQSVGIQQVHSGFCNLVPSPCNANGNVKLVSAGRSRRY